MRTSYTAADEVAKVQSAYGVTGTQADEVTTTYSQNGKAATLTDAEANTTSYAYDGHDRLYRTYYPVATKGAGVSSTTDYEQLGYDAGGNVASFRKRDARVLGYSYDALNRVSVKTVPDGSGLAAAATRDVYYGYDNRGLPTYARFVSASGEGIAAGWGALGRQTARPAFCGGG